MLSIVLKDSFVLYVYVICIMYTECILAFIVRDYFIIQVNYTLVELEADSSFFNEYWHIHLCLSRLSMCLIELGETYLMAQSDFRWPKLQCRKLQTTPVFQ